MPTNATLTNEGRDGQAAPAAEVSRYATLTSTVQRYVTNVTRFYPTFIQLTLAGVEVVTGSAAFRRGRAFFAACSEHVSGAVSFARGRATRLAASEIVTTSIAAFRRRVALLSAHAVETGHLSYLRLRFLLGLSIAEVNTGSLRIQGKFRISPSAAEVITGKIVLSDNRPLQTNAGVNLTDAAGNTLLYAF